MYLQAYTLAYFQNLAENGPVVTDKTSLSFIVNNLGPRSRNDLDLQYSYIFINSITYRSQAAIVSEKSTFFHFFLLEKPKLQNLTLL